MILSVLYHQTKLKAKAKLTQKPCTRCKFGTTEVTFRFRHKTQVLTHFINLLSKFWSELDENK